MSTTPLGQFGFSQFTLGDGASGTLVAPLSNQDQRGLLITYRIAPQSSLQGIPVSYTIEQIGRQGLPIYYLIGPTLQAFAVNGDTSIPAPESMTYIPAKQVGIDLNLGVVIQGYAQLNWSWASLSYPEIQRLLAHYDPQQPSVTVTYPNDEGFWVTRAAMLQPPQIGQRAGGETYNGLTLVFTHLIPD